MAKQHNDLETIESLELNAKLVRPKEATVPLLAAGADEGEETGTIARQGGHWSIGPHVD